MMFKAFIKKLLPVSDFEKMREYSEKDIDLDRVVRKAIDVYAEQEDRIMYLISSRKTTCSELQAHLIANKFLMHSFGKDLHIPHALLTRLLTSTHKEDQVMYGISYLWEVCTFIRREIVRCRHGETVVPVVSVRGFVIVEDDVKDYFNPNEEEKTWHKTIKIHEDFAKSTQHICASFRKFSTHRVRLQSAELIKTYDMPSRVILDEVVRGREILDENSPF